VQATLTPSSDSDIKIEVWLPSAGWNRKLQAVGNGGWAGTIDYGALAAAVTHGYAAVATDTGHSTEGASFAYGHAEKMIDYAYRSEHEMTVAAKAVVQAFHGAPPARSYFNGCSTGGRQALVEAQRYPNDFDGIIAGAAANPKAHLDAWRLWMAQAMLKSPESVIPVPKHAIIHAAVLAQCDALDGVKDGLLENPTACHFDPKSLQCQGADGPGCLTAAQVETARVIMSPAKNRKTGELIFPTYEPGTELGWSRLLGGTEPYGVALDQFRYIVFNPQWDWRTFDLERDVAASNHAAGGVLAAVNPDLSAFAAHGGKLLTYHGFSDPSIAPQASINFYKNARAATKPPDSNQDWLRLFMVPGMGHCSGGDGPNVFDMVPALEAWVEQGTPPSQVLASHFTDGKVDRTRPLCPYPQVARYKGTGSIDEAANFSCAAP
jgi:feruloyl esterase